MRKVYISIFLTMVILTTSIYMVMPDKVKIHVQNTKTDFYVYNEGWVLSATGYVNLFDGTKKMRAKTRSVYNETFGDTTIITREAYYKDNIVTIDKYVFDSNVNDVELFPISHETTCTNCQGKILHYEYRNIGYDGVTRQASSPESFANNMKIEWQDGYYYAKVFQQLSSDKLVIRYRPTEDVQTFNVRMFDPEPDDFYCYQETANISTACGGLDGGSYSNWIVADPDYHWINGSNVRDGDWTTFGLPSVPQSWTNMVFNYEIPVNANNNSLWQVGYYNGSALIKNLTIDPLCWNYGVTIDTLIFHVFTFQYEEFNLTKWDCQYTSSAGNRRTLLDIIGGDDSERAYEEAMWWNLDNITITANGTSTNKSIELNTKINITATTVLGNTVCIDIDHPDYGTNYSCGTNSTSFIFNTTYFRKKVFNDSTTYQNLTYIGPQNQTIYINAHQYDELDSVTLNMTPFESNGTNPRNINIYINDSLSNSWTGELQSGSQSLQQFNDTATSKIYPYNTSGLYTDYYRIPKVAVVGNAILNVTGSIRETSVTNEYYLIIIAQSVTCSNFELNGVDCVQLSPGRWKINKSADSYEDNRADVLATVFVGVYPNDGSRFGTSPITTVSGLTALQTIDESDVGLRGYTMCVDAESVSGDQEVELIGNTTDAEAYVSSWSNLAAIQFSGFGTARSKWYIPSASERNSVSDGSNNVWVNSNEMGTDKKTDEQTDPLDMKCSALATESASDTARAISASFIMSNSSITFTNITKKSSGKTNYLESVDFYIDKSVPLLTTLIPTNNWIEVGIIDGTREWSSSNLFNTTETVTNFSSSIETYLDDCDADIDGFCTVPITTQSGSAGKLTLDTVEINYTTTYNPFTLDLSLIREWLGNSTEFTNIPIKIENDQNGTIEVNDLRFDYAGGNQSYIVKAHTPDYTVNRTINLTLYYSDYDIDLPDKIDYLEFIPSTSTSLNVSPFGQTNSRGILVVNTTNYGGTMNLSMYLNETHECVNLTVSEDYSKGNGTQLSANDWTNVGTNKVYESDFELWMFADYACNYTEWVQWSPDFYFRGCEVDSVCSEDVS